MKKWLWLLFPLLLTAGERVVSLSPAVTDLIIFSGGGSALCGRSGACLRPDVARLPVAGDLGLPFVEAVVKCRPTVVLSDAVHPQAQWGKLRKFGIRVEILENRTLEDLPRNVRRIGEILRIPEAEKKAAQLEMEILRLRRSRPALARRAVILFGVSPLITCGSETFISSALAAAGVENAAADAGKGYFIISREYFLTSRAEYIFIIGVPENLVTEFFSQPIWQNIPAVKMRRIIFLDPDKWSRLTPELPAAAAALKAEISSP